MFPESIENLFVLGMQLKMDGRDPSIQSTDHIIGMLERLKQNNFHTQFGCGGFST